MLFMFGGLSSEISDDLYMMEFSTGRWDSIVKLTKRFCWKKMEQQSEVWPSRRFEHCSLMLKNHLLIFAGKSDLNKICGDMLVYNIRDCIWQKICLLKRPTARQDSKMVAVGDKVYLFGGRNSINNTFFNDLWEFDFGKMELNTKTNITEVTSKLLKVSGTV